MHAIIHRSGRDLAYAMDIAGRPLVFRQIQWLRTSGCDRIAVELPADDEGRAAAEVLSSMDWVGCELRLITTEAKAPAAELAARAGFPVEGALALPADLLGDGDLARLYRYADRGGATVHLTAFPELPCWATGGALRILGVAGSALRHVRGPGHAVRIDGPRAALALSLAVLADRLPPREDRAFVPLVHAAARSPGVWIARGAVVSRDAVVEGPCLIGRDAVVEPGARVGPAAIVGDRAVIEPGARVRSSMVDADVVVGEGLDVHAMRVQATGLIDLERDLNVVVDDPLLISSRSRGAGGPTLAARSVSLALIGLLAPIALLAGGLGPRSWSRALVAAIAALLDVVRGRRALVGVDGLRDLTLPSSTLAQAAARAPIGAIDVERALVEDPATLEDRLRARAWYAVSKSPRVDARLLVRALARRVTAPRREASEGHDRARPVERAASGAR